jgi:molybdopterin converting factor subunit 1
MHISVLFFGMLKEVVGRSAERLELPEGASLQVLLQRYANQFPGMRPMLPSLALAVNQEYSAAERVLRDGDEVGLLPPVSGGAGEVPPGTGGQVRIVREPIVAESVLQCL